MAEWPWAGSMSSPDQRFVLPAKQEGRCRSPAYLVAVVVPVVVIVVAVAGNCAVGEQAGEIVGMHRVTQEERPGHMEDLLQGAQIGRVREEHRARKRHTAVG